VKVKNVLAYLRASTQKQEKAETIEVQRQAIREFCKARGWKVTLFEDNGVSGECLLEHREGGRRLLAAAQAKEGELVVTYNATRVGRGPLPYVSAIAMIEQYLPLQTLDGNVLSVTQPGRIGPTMMWGGISAEDKAYLIARTKAGSQLKAKNPQHWMGGPSPLGYTLVNKRLLKLKSEAVIVQRIFRMAAKGDSCRTISDYLNAREFPAGKRENRAAQRWIPARIGNLLRNEIYRGVHYYGRREVHYIPGDPTHTPHVRTVPREKWTVRPVPELAIVDDALWHAANDAMQANLSVQKSHAVHQYVLSGVIWCGFCGRRFTGTKIHGMSTTAAPDAARPTMPAARAAGRLTYAAMR
jgi:site-specific DNA recombinase